MPLPVVEYCIVCEDVRPEPGNKLTILGFYGVIPKVDIIVSQWGQPLNKLFFLFSIGHTISDFLATVNILNPDGSILSNSGQTNVKAVEGATSVFGIGFLGTTFTQQGKHFVQFKVSGQEVFRQTFIVRPGVIPIFT